MGTELCADRINAKVSLLDVFSSTEADKAHHLRFATRSLRFMDAYRKGLDGKQAAWASKKFRGHRVLPASIMEDLDTAGLSKTS